MQMAAPDREHTHYRQSGVHDIQMAAPRIQPCVEGAQPCGVIEHRLPSRDSVPSARIRYRAMEGTAVLTVNRYCPSCVISTQQRRGLLGGVR